MERLYFAAGMPEKSEEEGNAWIQSIRREEPSLSREEKQHVPERIAAAYYIMGRAWMQTMEQDDHALKLLDTSISFYDKNADTFLQKALLLNRMKRNRDAREACDLSLIHIWILMTLRRSMIHMATMPETRLWCALPIF